jgi:hypothetical protein
MQTELGEEKKCAWCHDYWPLTDEFWHKRGDGFHSYCRACVSERSRELRNGAQRKTKRRTREEIKTDRFIKSLLIPKTRIDTLAQLIFNPIN